MRARTALGLVLAAALCGCPTPPDHSAPSPRAAPPPATPLPALPGLTKIRLGMTPFLAPETMRKTHEALQAYLTKQLSVPVELVVTQSYGDTIAGLERGDFDLVEVSPYAWAQVSAKVPLKCLVQSISDGTATASAYIFVRDDSPRHTLADLKGARVGFVDKHSTSGFLYPARLFKERGLPLDQFASVEFLGNHEAVAMAVLEGRVDVGATFQGSFSALWRARAIDPRSFRIIAKTGRSPRDALCARQDLPPEVIEAVRRALLQLDTRERSGREVLGPLNLNGYTPFDDRNYDEVRRVAAESKAE